MVQDQFISELKKDRARIRKPVLSATSLTLILRKHKKLEIFWLINSHNNVPKIFFQDIAELGLIIFKFFKVFFVCWILQFYNQHHFIYFESSKSGP